MYVVPWWHRCYRRKRLRVPVVMGGVGLWVNVTLQNVADDRPLWKIRLRVSDRSNGLAFGCIVDATDGRS
jgi:hypothetical protein